MRTHPSKTINKGLLKTHNKSLKMIIQKKILLKKTHNKTLNKDHILKAHNAVHYGVKIYKV